MPGKQHTRALQLPTTGTQGQETAPAASPGPFSTFRHVGEKPVG